MDTDVIAKDSGIRMITHEPELTALKELRDWQARVQARRTEVMRTFDPESVQEALARVWSLGFIESALWRIERRLEGRGVVDDI